jgi:carbonic anhydrase
VRERRCSAWLRETAASRRGFPVSRCGAIEATLAELGRPSDRRSWNLRSIVDRIRPSVEPLLASELRQDPNTLMERAVRANVLASANHLRHGSEVLERPVEKDGLLIVAGEYSLETGVVEFFDGVPAADPQAARAGTVSNTQ